MNREDTERQRLEQYPCPEIDVRGTHGVLLSDEIRYYAKHYRMIDPFEEKQLGPAGYELTVGHVVSVGGELHQLTDEPGKNTIKIPSFQVAVVETGETINLPRFIVGRWNVRVRMAYLGLVWVGGPHVDPGWVGPLSFPLYNLSTKECTLKLGTPIVVMDFVKTTPFNAGASLKYAETTPLNAGGSLKYGRPPQRVLFEDYEPEGLDSALYDYARQKIDDLETEVKSVRRTLSWSMGIGLSTVAIVVAAFALFAGSDSGSPLPDLPRSASNGIPWWLYLLISLAAAGVFFHICTVLYKVFSWIGRKTRKSGR